MMKKITLFTLLFCLFLFNVLSAQNTATYKITFESAWNELTHPVDYPSNAHWSGLVGMTHNASTHLFEPGMIATQGIVDVAQSGNRDELNNEIEDVIDDGGAEFLINGGWIPQSPDVIDFEFDISTTHPNLSIISMMAPSPDWFVALRDINLYENGEWAESRIFQFHIYDAGSDSGVTYKSSNENTDPREGISIFEEFPLFVNGESSSLGLWRIERVDNDSDCDVSGGELEGGPFEFCVNGTADNIDAGAITLDNVSGSNNQWIITDNKGDILGLPNSYTDVNFDAAGVGVCYIWHLSYEAGITGLTMGNNLDDLTGCFNLSNSTYVNRVQNEGSCIETATYKVTFESAWSELTHPEDFPSNAHWSGLVGMTHNASTHLFEPGMIATQGIVDMAQSGSRSELNDEIEDVIDDGGAEFLINGGGISQSPDVIDFEFDISSTHPFVSMTSMMAPSPDWFVAIRDINLYENGEWAESRIFQFHIYDAGSDSGVTFKSSNENTDPREGISIFEEFPLFVDGESSSLGLWRIERVDDDSDCVVNGGELEGGPFEFNIDGTADNIDAGAITVDNVSGSNSQWIITDDRGDILGLPNSFTDVNFDVAGVGICYIWHLSYEDGIIDLEEGKNLDELRGCFNLSNSTYVVRTQNFFADLNCTNLTVTTLPGATSAEANWTVPEISTNCDQNVGDLIQVNGPTNGSDLSVGVHTVEYMYETGCGVNPNCTVTITIEGEPAVLSYDCPDDIERSIDVGANGIIVNWDVPTPSSNCFSGEASIEQIDGPESGTMFTPGTTTITYQITDPCGSEETCSFTVTIEQDELTYNLECVDNITVNAPIGTEGMIVEWDTPNGETNCEVGNDGIEQSAGLASGSFFPEGTTFIEYTYDTGCGINTTCSFEVTVLTEAAVLDLDCPNNLTVNANVGATSALVEWEEVDANSNCSFGTTSSEQTAGLENGSQFPIGITTITYVATDACENEQNCSFEVTVLSEAAVLTLDCPENLTVNANVGATSALVEWEEVDVNSNCSLGAASSEQTAGLENGSQFPIGITTITYVATDACGNEQNCSFEVTVLSEAAVLTLDCPENLTVNANVGATTALVEWEEVDANSNCSLGAVSSEQTAGLENGNQFPIGITTVTYVATDACENEQNCSFDVTVIQEELVVTLDCPSNNSVQAPIGATGVIIEWDLPVGSTNCEQGSSELLQTAGLENGSFFPEGTTLVEYTFTTGCENAETCSFEITVGTTAATVDYSCPENVIVNASIGANTAIAEWAQPTASSDCFISGVTLNQNEGLANGSEFPLGTTEVNYIITDNCGNTENCNFNVTLISGDLTFDLSCPENILTNAPIGAAGMVVNWNEPIGSTNCEIGEAELTQTNGPENGSFLPVGLTTITYTYNTGCEVSTTCNFEINVLGTEAALEYTCPENIVVNALVGATTAEVEWEEPIVSTNCFLGGASFEQIAGGTSGSEFPIGTTIVTYAITDNCDNEASCNINVIIEQEELVVDLSCPENMILGAPIGSNGMLVNWELPEGNTNCEIEQAELIQTSGPENGSFLPVGETMIEYTYNSGCGENLTCSFTITVNNQDAILNFSCPDNILINALIGAVGVEVNWEEPLATSNCSMGTTESNQIEGLANGSIFPQGTNMVTYQAGDGCNNSTTCSFSVIVAQEELTINLECPEDLNIQVAPGETGMIVNWSDPIGTTNCEIGASDLSQTSGPDNGGFLPLGVTTIVYVYESGCELGQTCSFDITITVDSTTSTFNEALLSQNVQLYPNPANEVLYVNLEELNITLVNYQIYNSLGQQVLNSPNVSRTEQLSIDLKNLNNAIYMIVLTFENDQKITKPFVVQRN